jgi:hypothetical protein
MPEINLVFPIVIIKHKPRKTCAPFGQRECLQIILFVYLYETTSNILPLLKMLAFIAIAQSSVAVSMNLDLDKLRIMHRSGDDT